MGTRVTERDRRAAGLRRRAPARPGGAGRGVARHFVGCRRPRLRALAAGGFVRQEPIFHRQPSCYQITGKGLAAVGSGYRQPRLDLRCYRHDVGVAWLWLAARGGAFGPMRADLERRLRSLDAVGDRAAEPRRRAARRLRAGGRERLHYPDLLLVTGGGQRVAVELELTARDGPGARGSCPGTRPTRASTRSCTSSTEPAVARAIQPSARQLGISELVHVQRSGRAGR